VAFSGTERAMIFAHWTATFRLAAVIAALSLEFGLGLIGPHPRIGTHCDILSESGRLGVGPRTAIELIRRDSRGS
jgi:hypothetical protein